MIRHVKELSLYHRVPITILPSETTRFSYMQDARRGGWVGGISVWRSFYEIDDYSLSSLLFGVFWILGNYGFVLYDRKSKAYEYVSNVSWIMVGELWFFFSLCTSSYGDHKLNLLLYFL